MANRVPSLKQGRQADLPQACRHLRAAAGNAQGGSEGKQLSDSRVPRAKAWTLLGTWEGFLRNRTQGWEAGEPQAA